MKNVLEIEKGCIYAALSIVNVAVPKDAIHISAITCCRLQGRTAKSSRRNGLAKNKATRLQVAEFLDIARQIQRFEVDVHEPLFQESSLPRLIQP